MMAKPTFGGEPGGGEAGGWETVWACSEADTRTDRRSVQK